MLFRIDFLAVDSQNPLAAGRPIIRHDILILFGSRDRSYPCAVHVDGADFVIIRTWPGASHKQPGGDMYAGGSTGLAVPRRGGFVSCDGPGSLTTRPVTFTGSHLFVNAKGGGIRVEVRDGNGNVIAPFTASLCTPLRAGKTKQAVTWKGVPDPARPDGRPVRFRFHVAVGELYAFCVSPGRNGASGGYVAAGGPGFTGPTDTTGA